MTPLALRIPIPAGRFARELLSGDLPALPEDRREATLSFVESRLLALPGPMTVGVGAVALAVGALGTVFGHRRVAGFLGTRPLPVVRDYVRLLRSLSLAFVWETWPDTAPDGGRR